MTQPAHVIVGANDALLAGSQDGLDTYTSTGNPVALLGGNLFKPQGLAIDQDQMVWVATSAGSGPIGIPPPYDGTNKQQLQANSFIVPVAIAVYP